VIDGGFEEGGRGVALLIASDTSKRQAGMIIDGDVDELPSGLAEGRPATIAGDAMTYARDSAELFCIQMQ
jgi:hypothetical protein